jgi:NADH-quinone oxidoreductase subunit L
MTFGGQSRAHTHQAHSAGHAKSHESPAVMIVPMFILGILAVVSGFWNVTGGFNAFMGEGGETHSFVSGLFGVFAHPLPWIALLVACAGIALAALMYNTRLLSPEKFGKLFQPLYKVFLNKYWMDNLYEKIFVNNILLNKLFAGFQWIDTQVVDGVANGAGGVTLAGGKALRRAQTGQLQVYGLTIAIGIIAIIVCVLIFGNYY